MTAHEVVKILEAHGWVFDRIESSHHIYAKPGRRPIPVPFHGNEDMGFFAQRIMGEAGIKITKNKKKKR
jgi:predicted RNA binding protein YcfA (HicA-like mRNA interferase family)